VKFFRMALMGMSLLWVASAQAQVPQIQIPKFPPMPVPGPVNPGPIPGLDQGGKVGVCHEVKHDIPVEERVQVGVDEHGQPRYMTKIKMVQVSTTVCD
jgi:hypothetical protein